jgi:Uma2 family endonuclease
MSDIEKQTSITEEEYLRDELRREMKHEYVDGHIHAMAGATKNHERICQNITRKFGNHLKGSPCEPFSSDVKVKTPTGSFRYPDCMVVCNDESDNDYYTESPVILVEVLSRSTRKIDEKIKQFEYINIQSLEEYVLIEQDFVEIKVLRRSNEWRTSYYFLGENIAFESIGLTLSVEDIYSRVENDDMADFLK